MNTMYATKRRRRNGKGLKSPVKDVTKSNPSKRHRERLNAELDHLASLLPFEQSILSKLDRLSILRLSVSYLRTKSYFQAALHREHEDGLDRGIRRNTDSIYLDQSLMEGDLILQALNGFLLILTCDGEVFFASHTVENYLGFHQSDIVHQSVYELVHSEDREELQRHLMWNSLTSPESAEMSVQEVLQPDNSHFLERNFTIRFRCLLDNTSGFLRLDIRGRIKVLHGQNCKTEDPPLGLFAVCCPFGPPSLLEMPQKDIMFKSKHKLDLSLVSMDPRGKLLLGYSDTEITNKGGYEWIHFDDLAYVASAHQELLKTGASGLIAYRLLTKDNQWQWLQTSSRLVYKNGKPDFVICTHRPLMEEEGRDLLGKRTIDFKMAYMDERGLGFSERSYSVDNEFMSVIRSQKRKNSNLSSKTFCNLAVRKKTLMQMLHGKTTV
uniref:Spineless n=1 Tax=Euperipatoides kanangrensis TaxID=488523 RepID=X5JAI7_9BILA|nr:Spineless [Euperipatoides kanangrensis]